MEAIIKSISDIHIKHSKKINFSLLKVSEYRKTFTEDPECAICYKRIYNKVFVCEKPCAKTFHPACMENMIDRIEETADEEDEETNSFGKRQTRRFK